MTNELLLVGPRIELHHPRLNVTEKSGKYFVQGDLKNHSIVVCEWESGDCEMEWCRDWDIDIRQDDAAQ